MSKGAKEKFGQLINRAFLGGKLIAEKATPHLRLYLKWIMILSASSVLLPIPFLIFGIVTDLRWLTATVGIFWAATTLLLLAAASPLGILLESLDSGFKGSISKYVKFMSGVLSTELYLSLLFSIIPANSNLTYLPVFLICLITLGLGGAGLFKRRFIVVIISIVFLFLLFSFVLPAQYEKLTNFVDFLNRPNPVAITFDDLVNNRIVFFRSNGKAIYRYSISKDGRFEIFDKGKRNPFTQAKLKDLNGDAVERFKEQLKTEYERRKAEEARRRDLEERERVAKEAADREALKKVDLDYVVSSLASTVSGKMAENGLRKLVLIPFGKVGYDHRTGFDGYLDERLGSALRNKGRVSLADKSQIRETLVSLKTARPANLDYADLKKIGESSEADSILKGVFHEANGMVAINWSLFDVSGGNIVATGSADAAISPLISSLMNKVVEEPEPAREPELKNSNGQDVNPVPVIAATTQAPIPSPALQSTRQVPKRPLVIDYDSRRIRINVMENMPKSRRGTRLARRSTLSGYHIVEVHRAVVQEDTVTFAFSWTNLTRGTSRLLSSCLNRSGNQRPYLIDKQGRKHYCNWFKPADARQLVLYPNIPIHGSINFPSSFREKPGNDSVDLYIQLPGMANPPKSLVFRSLRMTS